MFCLAYNRMCINGATIYYVPDFQLLHSLVLGAINIKIPCLGSELFEFLALSVTKRVFPKVI